MPALPYRRAVPAPSTSADAGPREPAIYAEMAAEAAAYTDPLARMKSDDDELAFPEP